MESKKLIDELYFCSAVCDDCHKRCLDEKDSENLKRCMMVTKECYEICRLTGSLLEEKTENIDRFLQLCADICILCAEECEKHQHEHCQKCASECKRCAEMCLEHLYHVDV